MGTGKAWGESGQVIEASKTIGEDVAEVFANTFGRRTEGLACGVTMDGRVSSKASRKGSCVVRTVSIVIVFL